MSEEVITRILKVTTPKKRELTTNQTFLLIDCLFVYLFVISFCCCCCFFSCLFVCLFVFLFVCLLVCVFVHFEKNSLIGHGE